MTADGVGTNTIMRQTGRARSPCGAGSSASWRKGSTGDKLAFSIEIWVSNRLRTSLGPCACTHRARRRNRAFRTRDRRCGEPAVDAARQALDRGPAVSEHERRRRAGVLRRWDVDEIITALSRVRRLFVIARNSSFTYKGRAENAKEVGRELSVRYVLEGSVRNAGGCVRITAQLESRPKPVFTCGPSASTARLKTFLSCRSGSGDQYGWSH